MASASYHTRSNSFPSRPHPQTSEVDQHLSRLRGFQATSTSSFSSISHQINVLQDLQDCVDKWLQLSLIQQSFAQDQVDELLNGSLRLLDMCSIANDALFQTKECMLGLQSIFRRRRGDRNELATEIKKYLISRKAIKKVMHKALKSMEKKNSSPINEGHDTISLLKEVEAVTFCVIESLLSLISGSRTPSRSWSLVSKLMRPKRIACEQEVLEANEYEKVDAALSTIIGDKTGNSDNIFQVQNQLKKLDSSVQDLGLECLSRCLIKTRAFLLNILNK